MTTDLPPDEIDEILDLIYAGKKLQAIKRYCDLRSASLTEGKQFIDELTAKLKETTPERFPSTQPSSGKNWGTVIVTVIFLIMMLIRIIRAFF